MPRPTQKQPVKGSFRVHFVVPDDAGDIITEPLATGATAEGARITFSRHFQGKIACGLPRTALSDIERATGEVQHCWCNACKETDIYKAMRAQYDADRGAEASGFAEGAKQPCEGCR